MRMVAIDDLPAGSVAPRAGAGALPAEGSARARRAATRGPRPAAAKRELSMWFTRVRCATRFS